MSSTACENFVFNAFILSDVGVQPITCCLLKTNLNSSNECGREIENSINSFEAINSIDSVYIRCISEYGRWNWHEQNDRVTKISNDTVFPFVRNAFQSIYFYISHIRHEPKWSFSWTWISEACIQINAVRAVQHAMMRTQINACDLHSAVVVSQKGTQPKPKFFTCIVIFYAFAEILLIAFENVLHNRYWDASTGLDLCCGASEIVTNK